MTGAVVRLLRSQGYHSVLGRVIDGVEVDLYAVKASRRGPRGLIVEMKVLYRDSLVDQVVARRKLAHRVYVALPDWSVYPALAHLPGWVGIIAYNPVEDRAEVLRKAIPWRTQLADLIATTIALEMGIETRPPRITPRAKSAHKANEETVGCRTMRTLGGTRADAPRR